MDEGVVDVEKRCRAHIHRHVRVLGGDALRASRVIGAGHRVHAGGKILQLQPEFLQRRGGRGFTGGALRFLVQRGERLGLQEIAQVTARGGPVGQEIAGGFGEPWGSGSGHEWDKQLSQTRGGLTCP